MNYASFTRITWIDKQIQLGKLRNIQQIVEEFEVSTRTAERDLQKMRNDLGAEVKYSRSKECYEYVGAPITLPSQWLNKEEIALILIAEKALRNYTQTSFNEQVHPAFNQFLNPIRPHEEEMQYVRDMCNAVHFYQPFTPTISTAKEFAIVLSAILENKKIKINYHSRGAKDNYKIISPYLILNNNGDWQIVGRSQQARKVRTYALDRCSSIIILDEYFARPDGFNAADYYTHPFEFLYKAPFETIHLQIPKKYSNQLFSTTWHPSQHVTEKGKVLEITFTCHRTLFFKQWCRGMEAVEV